MVTMRVEAEAVVFEISTALGILEIVEFPRYASKGVLYAEDDGKQERPGPLVGHGSGDDKKSAGIERRGSTSGIGVSPPAASAPRLCPAARMALISSSSDCFSMASFYLNFSGKGMVTSKANC